jgi:hypothetical protein
VARDELLGSLWSDSFVEDANLTFQISSLCKALSDDGPKYIETLAVTATGLPASLGQFACSARPGLR